MSPKPSMLCAVCRKGTIVPIRKQIGWMQFDAHCPVCKSLVVVFSGGIIAYYDENGAHLLTRIRWDML